MTVFSQDLSRWLSKSADDLTGDGAVSHYELYHSNDGGVGAERLMRFPAAESPDGIDDLAQMIWDAAEGDAKTRVNGHPERYIVLSFRAEQPEHDSQHAFVLRDRGTISMFGDTDSPTPHGHLGQNMRHTEKLHQMLVSMTEVTTGKLMRDNAELVKRCERAEGQQLDMMETYQKLLDRSMERQLEQAEAMSKAKRKDEMTSFAMGLLPLLAAKFFAGDNSIAGMLSQAGGASPGSLRDDAIGKFLKNLSPEEVQGVFTSLQGQNRAVLLELYKSYAEDDKKAQEAKPEIFRDKEVTDQGDATSSSH